MNVLHMKYALEVAKAGSLSKASKVLLVATPNISRSVKELEADLGIEIFVRTTKGVKLTPEGEEFIRFAQSIVDQIDAQEQFYKNALPKKQKFSVSVPRSFYVSEAFAVFSKSLNQNAAEVHYRETNSQATIRDVAGDEYNLGVIRYHAEHDRYFKELLEANGITFELIAEYSPRILMSREHPLADRETIGLADLSEYIEVSRADSFSPSASVTAKEKKSEQLCPNRRIAVFERASELDLISINHEAFMWVSAVPNRILNCYGLVMKQCAGNKKMLRDLLIYKKGYRLTELDRQFITDLCEAKRGLLR